MAAKALIILGLAACAAASGESYQRVWRVDGYDQVPTEYGVRVNGYNAYVDEDRVGRLGKRSTYDYTPALAYHPAGGYGYSKYGPGYSYTDRSPQGLHKRDADASEPHYEPALAYHPAGGYGYSKYGPGYSYVYRSPQGLHKREAEPSYAPALAYHPAGGYGYNKYGAGYSYTDRSPQGIHKREAEPSYAPALAYHPAGGYGYNKYGPGYSYTDRSPQGARLHKRQLAGGALTLLGLELLGVGLAGQQGLLNNNRNRFGKREAEPSYAPALAYHPAGGYGYNKYGPGYSYTDRSPQGLHKREASGASYQTVERSDCYGYNCQNSEYNVKVNGYNGDVDESRDGKNFAFQYGFNN